MRHEMIVISRIPSSRYASSSFTWWTFPWTFFDSKNISTWRSFQLDHQCIVWFWQWEHQNHCLIFIISCSWQRIVQHLSSFLSTSRSFSNHDTFCASKMRCKFWPVQFSYDLVLNNRLHVLLFFSWKWNVYHCKSIISLSPLIIYTIIHKFQDR